LGKKSEIMKYRLRFTTDPEAIAALHMSALAELGKHYSEEEVGRIWQTVVNRRFITAERFGFLALHEREGNACYISDLYVDPAVRNQGVARALVQAVKARYGLIELNVDPKNKAARSLYISEGFFEIRQESRELADKISMVYRTTGSV
jgi:ribosomal protein S18 acetylase RimI-like enzyme